VAIDLRAEYDEGYFDKDEQGWCARRVTVTSEGARVTIHRSGDDNGARPYDSIEEGTIGPSWPELGLVRIDGPRGAIAYFDTRTRRLRSPGEQCSHDFVPPADYRGAGCLEAGLRLVVPVALELGMTPGPPPTEIAMPPLRPSSTAMGSHESQRDIAGENGCTWRFTLRDFPADSWLGPLQLAVTVEGQGRWSGVFVQGPERAHFLLIGPLELHARAIAVRDRVLAEWGATPRR
jgi:hypothetical protein